MSGDNAASATGNRLRQVADTPAGARLVFRGGQPAQLLIKGAHVLDPRAGLDGPADILVQGGVITQIGKNLKASQGTEVIEAGGLHAFPAFVDPHVHLRTPGFEYKEDIETGTRAAAAGGYCALIAMANTDPVVDSPEILRALKDRAASEAHVPVGFAATVTRGMKGEELTEMATLAEHGAAAFSDDGLPIRDAGVLRQALQYQRIAGRVLALHEEDPGLTRHGVMHEGKVSAALGLAGYPSIAESSMIARDAHVALYEGQRCHFQHLSARESVDAVRQAKALGAPVTCEVSPHHLLLTDDALSEAVDSNLKMNPPLRSEDDRQALIEGLRDGTIDCIATDHAPHAPEEKERPFEEAPMGVTGLETAFAAVYTALVTEGELELSALVEMLTSGAALFDLPTPCLQKDETANICLVDLGAEWIVGEDGFESKSHNSCFTGRTFKGRVQMTLAGGTVAFRSRQFSIQGLRRV